MRASACCTLSSTRYSGRRRGSNEQLAAGFTRILSQRAFPLNTPPLTSAGLSLTGRIKTEPEDFVVEEIPAYLPCGEGHHLFLRVEKRDMSAEFLVGHLARRLGIHREDIGVAGLKDRRAVTRQWVSVPMEVADRIELIASDEVQVLEFGLHRNKLKTGHLLGNRFQIVLRNVSPDALSIAQQIAAEITAKGVPNYFGDQRFGVNGETLRLGMALLTGEAAPHDIPPKRRKFLSRLALSAAQSSLFNAVLAQRLRDGLLHTVLQGDVLQKVATGGQFIAEDVAAEQARFDARETVITGPLFGPKMKLPLHQPHAREQKAVDDAGLKRDLFREHRKLTPGARRPLLIWPEGLEVNEHPHGLELAFTLPSGSYATIVLAEFLKSQIVGGERRVSSAESPELEEAEAGDSAES